MSEDKSWDENLLLCISGLSVMIQHPTGRRAHAHTHTHTHTQTLILLLEKRKSVSQVFSSVPLRCVALGQSHHIINMVDAIVITSTKQKHSLTWQHYGSNIKQGAIKYVLGGKWMMVSGVGALERNKWEQEREGDSLTHWKITQDRQWKSESLRISIHMQ